MAWTQADVDTLKAAMVRGEKTVTYGDKTVTYQSLQEQIALLQMMQSEVTTAAASSSSTSSRYSRVGFSRE